MHTELEGIPDTTTTRGTISAGGTEGLGLLDPSLKLDCSMIQKNLHKSDQAFVREVVKLIAERAENGIFARDCWGYKFLNPPILPSHRNHSLHNMFPLTTVSPIHPLSLIYSTGYFLEITEFMSLLCETNG